MEIVLQWLDELDDVVFAGLLAWERLRAACLRVGLLSALLVAPYANREGATWTPFFAAVAASCVLAALLGAGLAFLAEPSARITRRA
ncbi:MAG TPA: hypothetical protein VF329_02900 [Gammaproteobacteria bacterium]